LDLIFVKPNMLLSPCPSQQDCSPQQDTRDSDTIFVGVAADHTFSPNFLGDIRAGYQQKNLDDAVGDDEISSPYVDLTLTFLPSPDTRIATGVGFSQYEAHVEPFANQERFRVFGSLVKELTGKVTWYNTISLTQSSYDSDELSSSAVASRETGIADGDEDIVRFGTRLSYRMNRSNWLEAGWSHLTFDSDVRSEFDRNRLSLAWRTRL
ncbi:MAG: outer membrane beta-barrel protein, partial [Verrucomicrobiota bacterium]